MRSWPSTKTRGSSTCLRTQEHHHLRQLPRRRDDREKLLGSRFHNGPGFRTSVEPLHEILLWDMKSGQVEPGPV
jgi:hypothetical protein